MLLVFKLVLILLLLWTPLSLLFRLFPWPIHCLRSRDTFGLTVHHWVIIQHWLTFFYIHHKGNVATKLVFFLYQPLNEYFISTTGSLSFFSHWEHLSYSPFRPFSCFFPHKSYLTYTICYFLPHGRGLQGRILPLEIWVDLGWVRI